MKFFIIVLCMAMLVLSTGCTALNNLSAGMAEKSISGGGTLVKQRMGLDETTQMPVMSNLVVVGDYTSAAAGDDVLRYEEIEDCSIFNTSATTKTKRLLYISADETRVKNMLKDLQSEFNKDETPTVTE